MNEIERAIETLEKRLTLDKFNLYQAASVDTIKYHNDELAATQTALTVLRAELSRQENAPLTCERYFEEDGGQCWSCCCRDENGADYKVGITCKGDRKKCCI